MSILELSLVNPNYSPDQLCILRFKMFSLFYSSCKVIHLKLDHLNLFHYRHQNLCHYLPMAAQSVIYLQQVVAQSAILPWEATRLACYLQQVVAQSAILPWEATRFACYLQQVVAQSAILPWEATPFACYLQQVVAQSVILPWEATRFACYLQQVVAQSAILP
jgi:hypothetical protein